MSLKSRYDIVIAGAGPAGCVAAERAARAGLSVLLCEKRNAVGVPVRCAELSGYEHEIAAFIPLSQAFITDRIKRCRVVAPSGAAYEQAVPYEPLSLDRARFDQALFNQAVEHGAHGHTHADVVDAAPDRKGRVKSVTVRIRGKDHRVDCDFLIGADGVESTVGRLVGIPTRCPIGEIYSCLQYCMAWSGFERGTISFYLGRKVAPCGYVWIFPKGDGTANVGIGLLRKKGDSENTPWRLLSRFTAEHLPKARIAETVAGGVPVDGGLKTFVKGNTVLIGDAAHHANPFSGGGIMNSMEDADLLIQTLLILIKEKRPEDLKSYEKIHNSKYGRILRWQRVARNVFYSLDDKKIDRLFLTLKKSLHSDRYDAQAFEQAARRAFLRLMPSLITKVGHLFK